jgi:UDP-N-acetyl-D-mannosaminuronic acid dehydrogenase
VVEKLAHSGVGKILVVEPHVNKLPAQLDSSALQLEDFETALKAANLIVLLVGHQAFLQVDRDLLKDKFVIDTVGAW